MEQRLTPTRFLFATAIALGVLFGASVMLPHDRYHRFQAHDNVTTRKADWIYERLHFDPTPIDVALIGTSRTAGGLSAPLIETAYCEVTGRTIHVANLAIPVTGRNMHYVIAREAARTKAPALVVVELNDIESRRPHNGFIFLADARDVLTAPLMINLNYFSDLLRLPGRQLELFYRDITGDAPLRARFDPRAYQGSHLDLTANEISLDGKVVSRDIYLPVEKLKKLRSIRRKKKSSDNLLPSPLSNLEYRFSRVYLNKLEAAVDRAGGAVSYAYLPAYGAPELPIYVAQELEIESYIDLGGALAADPNNWLDATHFNLRGATLASYEFARLLALHKPSLGAPASQCD